MPTSVVIPTENLPPHGPTKKREPPMDGKEPHSTVKKKVPLPFTHRHWTLPRIGADLDWEKQYDNFSRQIQKLISWFAKIIIPDGVDDDEKSLKNRGKYAEEFDKKVELKEEKLHSYFTALNEIYEAMPENDKDRFCFLLQRAGITNMEKLSQDCRVLFEKEFIGGQHFVSLVSVAEPWLRIKEEKEFRQAYKALPNFQKQLVVRFAEMCESTYFNDSSRRQPDEQFRTMRDAVGLSTSTKEPVPASKNDYTNVKDLLGLLETACRGYCESHTDDAIHKYLRNAANSAYFDRRTAKVELQAVKKIMSTDLFLLVVQVCKVKRRALDYEEFVQEQYPQFTKEERKMIGSFAKVSQAPVGNLVFQQPRLKQKSKPIEPSSSDEPSTATLRSSMEDFISTPGFHPVSDLPRLYQHLAKAVNDLPDKDIFISFLNIAANWNNEGALRQMFPNYRRSSDTRYLLLLNNHVNTSMNALKERLGPRVFPLVMNASRIRALIPACFCGKVYNSTFDLYKHHIRAWSSCIKTRREIGAVEPDIITDFATQINKRTFSATPSPDLQRVTVERILRLHKTSRAAQRGLYLIDTFSISFNTTEFIQTPARDRSIFLLNYLRSRCEPQVQDVEELLEVFLDDETTVIIPWVLSAGNWLSESHTVILVLATQDDKRTFLRVDFDGSTAESDEHLAWFNQSFSILLHALQHQGPGLPKKLRRRTKEAWSNVEDAVEDRGVTLTRDEDDVLWNNTAGMLNTIALCSFIAMMSEEAAVENPVEALDEVLEAVRLLCGRAKTDKEVFDTLVDLALMRPFVEAAKTQLQLKDSVS